MRAAIGNGGPVGYTLALVSIFGLVGAALDVGMDVEVAEEDEHDDHVAGQEVLAPEGEVTAHTYRVDCVGECHTKLHLKQA